VENQVVDFVTKYPIVLIPLLFVGVYFRYRRFQRRTEGAGDQRSKRLLVLGGAVTGIIIAFWVLNS
jgi:hypothetical protein